MLSRFQFDVLRALKELGPATQRSIASSTGLSLGTINKAVKSLQDQGAISANNALTEVGEQALRNSRVDGAVILAAGMATRLAPLSFEHPKALFQVQGEVLIERLIRQLKSANISKITVVVGHMKEQFFYLEDRFGVDLVEAPEYLNRNNHASVLAAGSKIENAYICSSDQLFLKNPFHEWEYASCCMTVRSDAATTETQVTVNSKGIITSRLPATSHSSWSLLGPAFLSRQDASKLLSTIKAAYDLPETRDKLWEQILLDHIDDYQIYASKMDAEEVREFDRMEDLCSFDSDFLDNVDSSILDNICNTLGCQRADITQVEPLTTGLTNLSVLFSCNGESYVYRFPGAGTGDLINREAETYALETARDLGLDTTYILEDKKSGWKLSRYIPNCMPFDYSNPNHVSLALEKLRTLHKSESESPWKFDFYDEAVRITSLLKEEGVQLPADFQEMSSHMDSIAAALRNGAGKIVLCHNDFYGPNILITSNEQDACIIDWEYAAMGDYGCDLGNFIAQGSGYSVKEAISILPEYFGREPSDEEKTHVIMCTAIVGWYWYVWALFKEHSGSPTGPWLRIWYSAAKEFGSEASSLLENSRYSGEPLSFAEFSALTAIIDNKRARHISPEALEALSHKGLIEDGSVTASGFAALEPYRAKRAIFFAAGFGSRMLPITINTPKPLVRVWGKRIIDRLLDAVNNVGIDEIYVVRGYLKEEFDQLLASYPNITFIDNPLFDSTNNISSALAAKDLFENAYAFESDLLLQNPSLITRYQYRSNYLAFPVERTEDWCFDADEAGRITKISKGSDKPCWQMVGLSYWSKDDGRRLSEDLPDVFYANDKGRQIFWDDVALDQRPDQYTITIRECNPEDIVEIDTFQELQDIDQAYRLS